ncbi:transcriptional antiterminator RfaH [Azotobacter beijerinckii]|uniref:Transcription antitermination protein RfaH n=1 Tax=Azotobacter beijerinckii TaxID=170623 RepID=A0A1H9GPL1_9GAMM|nr:transcription/translation regulatory transformer protein RfaH [Azotobacter beijerinckii]SEQ52055.1 transcriptional antiterminator RfaH [Azotobacter beijerinckii]
MNICTANGASSMREGKAWYLVQCKPRQDERAEENLGRQGYEYFRPLCRRERLVRGALQVQSESLFPGYLFIQLAADANWAPLRSTRGVSRLVGFGGMPMPIADELIAELQRRVQLAPQPALQPGDRVCITSGSFAELDAIFLAMDGEERVVLLMSLLHRKHRLSMPLANIRKY